MDYKDDLFKEMIQYVLVKNELRPDIFRFEGHERPPIIDNPDYRERFNITV